MYDCSKSMLRIKQLRRHCYDRKTLTIQNTKNSIGKFFGWLYPWHEALVNESVGSAKSTVWDRTVEKSMSSSDGRLSDQNYCHHLSYDRPEKYRLVVQALLLFFGATIQAFCAAHVGLFHNWSSQAYWAVECASPLRSHFSTARRYLQNKIPNLHSALGGWSQLDEWHVMNGRLTRWFTFESCECNSISSGWWRERMSGI